uniref:SMB domain-containing protein n=1 Tax=Branchiostoma floridae TaxID=7739 RepID=C3YAK2_BRAFL|eukprot:XP_002606740.1 hypothetical protein BRAFLDRAFT_82379 [Branchiostoma floridae]
MRSPTLHGHVVALLVLLLVSTGSPNEFAGNSSTPRPPGTPTTSAETVPIVVTSGEGHTTNTTELHLDHTERPLFTTQPVAVVQNGNTTLSPASPTVNRQSTPLPDAEIIGTSQPTEAPTSALTTSFSGNADNTEDEPSMSPGDETFGGSFGWGPLLPPQEPTEPPTLIENPTTAVSNGGDKSGEQATEWESPGNETFGGDFGWGLPLPSQEPTEEPVPTETTRVSNDGDKTGEQATDWESPGDETFGGEFGWGPLLPPQEPTEATTLTETLVTSVSNGDGDKTGEQVTEWESKGEETLGGGFGWGPLLPPQEPTEAPTEASTPSVHKDGDKTNDDKTREQITELESIGDQPFGGGQVTEWEPQAEETSDVEKIIGGGFGWGPLLPPQEPTEAPAKTPTTSVSTGGENIEEELPVWKSPEEEPFGGGFGWGPFLPPEEPTEAATPSVSKDGDKTGEQPSERESPGEEAFGGGFGWGPFLPPQQPTEETIHTETTSVSKEGEKNAEELPQWGPPKDDSSAVDDSFGGGFGWGPFLPPEEPTEAPAEAPAAAAAPSFGVWGPRTRGGGFGWDPTVLPQEPTEAPVEAAAPSFGAWGPQPAAAMDGGLGWGPLIPPAEPTEPTPYRDFLNLAYGQKYPAVAPCMEMALCESMLRENERINMMQARCHCDVQCRDFRDCCVDIDDVQLPNTTGSTSPAAGSTSPAAGSTSPAAGSTSQAAGSSNPAAVIHPDSCRWRCGRTSLFSRVTCGCDVSCESNGTCCDDFRDVCVTGSSRSIRQDDHEPLQCVHAPNATDHYWMVASCPQGYPASKVRTLCEAPDGSTGDLLLEAPVVENGTGVPFRNMFCGICNGAQHMVTWETRVLCSPGLDETRVHTNLSGVLGAGLCTRQGFSPSSSLPARRCFPPIEPTPSLRSSSMCDETECQRLTALVYHKHTGHAFRNGYCLGCVHDIDSKALADDALSCESPTDANAEEGFSFASRSSEMSAIILDGKAVGISVGECENDSLYDPYENSCRDLGISFDFQTNSKGIADDLQNYSYIALNTLSLLSLLVFFCFSVKERKRLKPMIMAKISLLVALLLVQGSQILGDVSSSPVLCKVAAVGKLLFSMVALLTVALTMRYYTLSGNANMSKGRVAVHVATSWALAVLAVTVLLVVDLWDDLVSFVMEYDLSTCWLSNSDQAILLLGIPTAPFTLVSCCLLVYGFVAHRRTETSMQFVYFAEGALLIALTTGMLAVGVLTVTHGSAQMDTAFRFCLACMPGVLALVFLVSNASKTRRKQDAAPTHDAIQEPAVAECDQEVENEVAPDDEKAL